VRADAGPPGRRQVPGALTRAADVPATDSAVRRNPVRTVTVAVLVATALIQGLVAHSVALRSWWDSEWVRLLVHNADPTAAYGQHAVPAPGWQVWVPSAATSVLLTSALVLLALLVVRVGRSWWLLAVAALPLVPTELAPGAWAPPLSNQLAYALVWPAGATEPETAWAWVSAAMTAVLVALPAATLAVSRTRTPWLSPGLVLQRLVPVGLAAGLWLGLRAYGGDPAGVLLTGWLTILVLVGALATTGYVRRSQVLLLLAVLPALAAGLVRWTTGVDGVAHLEVDASAWWMSVAAVGGGVWAAYVSTRFSRGVSWVRHAWSQALHQGAETEVDRAEDTTDGRHATVAERDEDSPAVLLDLDELEVDSLVVPDDLSAFGPERIRVDEGDPLESAVEAAAPDRAEPAVTRRRGRGASARPGGRHRA
jgi:hypothetical protein